MPVIFILTNGKPFFSYSESISLISLFNFAPDRTSPVFVSIRFKISFVFKTSFPVILIFPSGTILPSVINIFISTNAESVVKFKSVLLTDIKRYPASLYLSLIDIKSRLN